MTRHFILHSAIVGLCLAASPAVAEDTPKPTDGPRFSMAVVEGGLMRLDGATGRLSFCVKDGASYACKSVADDRSGFMDEIEALAKENADLKKQIAENSGGGLPKEEDIDRAFNLMERFVKRFGNREPAMPQAQ
jgi:hypothetical protein